MTFKTPPKILITAFDVSADHNIAEWITYLQENYPNQFTFEAFAGEKVASTGTTVIADTTTQSSIGFFSSLKYIPSSLLLFSKIKQLLSKQNYDLVLCIDGQGRNLIIGKIAHKLKIKTAYYFPPTAFIFGKNVLKKMNVFDLILCPFYPNYELYLKHQLPATFIGHPFTYLKDKQRENKDSIREEIGELGISPSQKLIALFPGSRSEEIKKLLPLFLDTVDLYEKHSQQFTFVISLAHQHFYPLIKKILKKKIKIL